MSIPKYKTILYATDLGKNMRPVFRQAVSLAQQYEAKIIMLHVAEPLGNTGRTVLELYMPDQAEDFEKNELRTILDKMQQRLEAFYMDELGEDSDIVESVIVEMGQPAKIINKEAMARDVDLIVVGTETNDRFGSSLMGSTVCKLIHISDKPVLVVPVKKH